MSSGTSVPRAKGFWRAQQDILKKIGLIINGKNTIFMNLDSFTPADNEKLLKDFGQRRDTNYLHYNVTLLSTMPVTQLPTQHSHLDVSQTGKLKQFQGKFFIFSQLFSYSLLYPRKRHSLSSMCSSHNALVPITLPYLIFFPLIFCLYCQKNRFKIRTLLFISFAFTSSPSHQFSVPGSLQLILVYSSPSFTLVFPIHSSRYSKNNISKTKVSSCMLQ